MESQVEGEVAADSHRIALCSFQATPDSRPSGAYAAVESLEARLAIRHTADTEGSTA